MTDRRNFEWTDEARIAAHNAVAYMQAGRGIVMLRDAILEKLLPYVQEALADEFDRGYETALRRETDLQRDAWDEGFEEGKGYGAYLEGGYGHYPLEPNPYR